MDRPGFLHLVPEQFAAVTVFHYHQLANAPIGVWAENMVVQSDIWAQARSILSRARVSLLAAPHHY